MSETNQSLTQAFYAYFQAAHSELGNCLESYTLNGCAPEALDQLSLDIAKLRKELTEATSFLPSYDQRQCDIKLKELEESLQKLRTVSAPKPKFTFKRKVNKPSISPILSNSTQEHVPNMLLSSNISAPAGLPSTTFSLSGYSHEYLTFSSFPASTAIDASDLVISDLDHCVVNLLPSTPADLQSKLKITALHARNVRNCILLLPQIEGSALLHDLSRCVIVLGCHQYRMHTSSQTDVYIAVSSKPIIEHCTNIRFSLYPAPLRSADTNPMGNNLSVQDFSHIRPTPSPNWALLAENELIREGEWPVHRDVDVDEVLRNLLPSA
ncbi:TBCC-domain-containing protein [Laetiporus sulphureus 93-53]|uniref:TBCC-domain-containing protein n=1 Tax=Laetiporus sulphureus 93-53 TaxID=1314785 RepID=A0A165DID2_9APHY|nr:TBCC-domain-containing protein [Laetiporus sulphureus 93-53]KZT04949.1 TBCC-domain-containing protein [Laetiporus sulphureus 93-53]